MSALLAIVRRDLVRWRRNPGRLALLLALPLVLAAIFALAFGSGGSGLEVRVLVIDEDETPLSDFLVGALSSGEQDFGPLDVAVVGEEGREMIERGEASALVVIPEGFSENFLDGRPAHLELVKNPAEQFLPQAVEEALRAGAVVLSQASRTFRDELSEFSAMLAAEGSPDPAAVGAMSTRIAEKMQLVGPWVFPPVIQLETASAGKGADEDHPTMEAVLALVLPGLAVLSLLFFAQAATRDVMEERERGLLRQLLTAPVSAGQYLVAKSVSIVLVSALGFGFVIALGALAGVSWGPPAAVAALVLASSLAASGLLLALVSLAGSETAANALTTIVVMVSAMVGGSFVPLPALPAFLLPISRLTVNYWATHGFLTLIRDGGGLADVGREIAVLSATGAVLLVFGAFRLARRIRRGGI